MNISSFSKIDKTTSSLSRIMGKIAKVFNANNIFVGIGLVGWIIGMMLSPMQTMKIFGIFFLFALVVGMFLAESRDSLGLIFVTILTLGGYGGFYFPALKQTTVYDDTNKSYMVNPVIKGNKVEYIGGDKMTKIITISNEEILAHYKHFKDTDRLKAVKVTTDISNIILDYIGIEYSIKHNVTIKLRDVDANKSLFTIK